VNRLANQAGNRLGNRVGYRAGWQGRTGLLTESSHVRAIASRPDPSLPLRTEPYPGAIPPTKNKSGNGNGNFSFCRTSRGRARTGARAER
jgi:hypothetical protein